MSPVTQLQPQSVLLIPPHFVGDAILTVPLLRHLKQQLAGNRIGLVVPPSSLSLMEACPYVDDWHVWQSPKRAFWQTIKQARYDTALLLRNSLSDAWAVQQAGIPRRIGYRRQRLLGSIHRNWGLCLTDCINEPALDTTTHQVRHLLDGFLPPLGLTAQPHLESLELWPTEAAELAIQPFLPPVGRPLAILHFAAASQNKGVALPMLLPVLLSLANQGYRLLLTGPQEMAQPYNDAWRSVLDAHTVDWHNLAGRTSLPQLLALLTRANLLVSLDSAPVHMAAAVGTPAIVTLYGATNAERWAPWHPQSQAEPVYLSLPCRPCLSRECAHNQCRTELTSQHILQAIHRATGQGA